MRGGCGMEPERSPLFRDSAVPASVPPAAAAGAGAGAGAGATSRRRSAMDRTGLSCWCRCTLVTVVLLGMCHSVTTTYNPPNSGPHDYCLDETFEARCQSSQVIQLGEARYGRMSQGSCVSSDYGHVGCGNDVGDILALKCSGRPDCEVVNIEATLSNSKLNCPQDLKPYLEATYGCLPVDTDRNHDCKIYGEVTFTSSSGYISSGVDISEVTDCPIIIKGKAGQKIRITLIDYTDFSDGVSDDAVESPQYCREYAVISDGKGRESIIVCNEQERERQVYLSETSEVRVELRATHRSDLPSYYLLKYEVFGCARPQIYPGMYVAEATDTSLNVRCNGSEETWLLTCHDNVWHGSLGNCSGGSPLVGETISIRRLLPYGISILIIIAVAVSICILILIFGVLHIKGKQRARDRLNENHLLAPPGTPSVEAKLATLRRNTSMERAYSPMSRTMRIPATGGEYAHIWELRKPIPVDTPEVPECMANRQLPDPTKNTEVGDKWSRVSSFKPVDHIYESPKFERIRRPHSEGEPRPAEAPVTTAPYYFTLDPNSPEIATLPMGEYPGDYPVCTCGLQQATLPLRQVPLAGVDVTCAKDTV